MTKRWIVVDLDGTLCDCSHRVHWAQAKQWDEFHAGIPEDKCNEDVANMVSLAAYSYEVLVCTGRNEAHRKATEDWLTRHGLGAVVTDMLMRPDDDRSPDHELKIRLVSDYFGGIEKALNSVLLVLDDRDKVVEAWRDAGFKCWQVQQGSY